MAELLFEIGTEELPAGFVDPALAFLETEIVKQCAEQRLTCTVSRVDGTPRRLVVIAEIAEKQSDLEEEITGPLWSVAFKEDGTPTPAGEGFLKKNNLTVADVKPKDGGKKGPVISGVRKEAGKATVETGKQGVENVAAAHPVQKDDALGRQVQDEWPGLRAARALVARAVCRQARGCPLRRRGQRQHHPRPPLPRPR